MAAGASRELHWHPNGSARQYWIKGKGRMTVFSDQEAARTMDFNANDVGFVPNMAGHYIEKTPGPEARRMGCSPRRRSRQ